MSPSCLRLGIRQSLDTKPGCLIFMIFHDSKNTAQKKKQRSITSAPILHMEREPEKKKKKHKSQEKKTKTAALSKITVADKKSLNSSRHVICNNYPPESNAKFL